MSLLSARSPIRGVVSMSISEGEAGGIGECVVGGTCLICGLGAAVVVLAVGLAAVVVAVAIVAVVSTPLSFRARGSRGRWIC